MFLESCCCGVVNTHLCEKSPCRHTKIMDTLTVFTIINKWKPVAAWITMKSMLKKCETVKKQTNKQTKKQDLLENRCQ